MIDKVTVPAGTTWQDLRTLLSGTLRNEAALLQSPVGREVTTDSRRVEEGSVFVAYRGVYQDGHQYLPQAVESGAALCILEDDEGIPSGIPAIVVEDARFAISKLSAFCSGYPTRQVKTFGITGTNGKTTNLWLLSEALRLLGERVITLGTLGVLFEGETYSKGEATTPTAQEIHSSIAHALRLGATACVMEVSSHALKQRRADDVCFDGAIFTNLTPDHLNYHPDEEDYFQAKKRLFELTLSNSPEAPLVCGRFDDYGRRLSDWAKEQSSRAYSFGMDSECDFILQDLEVSIDGIQCTFVVEGNTYRVHSPLIGRFNAENLLGVFSLLCALGHPPADAVALLERIGSPSGRMERFSYGDAKIFVDYAHAPDALRNALSTLKEVTEGRLWVLFGSGGGKDPRRRAGMGAVAKELADAVVLTADNPRKEDPQKIVEDILASGVQVQFVELDRAKAIEKAIRAMGERDVMLVAGKGQEDFQIIGDKTFYLSDQAEVQRVIDELQAR